MEKVQNRAARFVTKSYTFEEVQLAFLNNSNGNLSRKVGWIIDISLYKGLKGKARIPTDDLIPKTRRRNSHSKAFQLPSAGIEAYKCSFFPQTIRDWQDLRFPLLKCQMIATRAF